jgi:hypothetical protein
VAASPSSGANVSKTARTRPQTRQRRPKQDKTFGGIFRYRLGCRECIGRSGARWRRGRRKQLVARIVRHHRDAARQRIGDGCEIGHRRGLVAVERVLNHRAPATGLQIDKVGHVAGDDPQAERTAQPPIRHMTTSSAFRLLSVTKPPRAATGGLARG